MTVEDTRIQLLAEISNATGPTRLFDLRILALMIDPIVAVKVEGVPEEKPLSWVLSRRATWRGSADAMITALARSTNCPFYTALRDDAALTLPGHAMKFRIVVVPPDRFTMEAYGEIKMKTGEVGKLEVQAHHMTEPLVRCLVGIRMFDAIAAAGERGMLAEGEGKP